MASDATDERQTQLIEEAKGLGLTIVWHTSGEYLLWHNATPDSVTKVMGLVALEAWFRGYKYRMSTEDGNGHTAHIWK